jgi:hypothetical protein
MKSGSACRTSTATDSSTRMGQEEPRAVFEQPRCGLGQRGLDGGRAPAGRTSDNPFTSIVAFPLFWALETSLVGWVAGLRWALAFFSRSRSGADRLSGPSARSTTSSRLACCGDRDLGEIVEEIVEQDLGRQHRQERQEEESGRPRQCPHRRWRRDRAHDRPSRRRLPSADRRRPSSDPQRPRPLATQPVAPSGP